jgi:peptidyl-prolyl cis-trans isomerase SurA
MKTLVRLLGAALVGLALSASMALPALAATKVEVNGEAISDSQVAQRLKLFAIEGKSGQKAAMEELINEALMMQEAKRLGITVTDSQVDEALLNVARNIRVSQDNLRKLLQDRGVNIDTLKARLRANIAWGQVTQQAIMPRVQISDVELEKQAESKLTAASNFDYILKEVVFVLPGGKGNASGRTSDANRYRKSFAGCDTAVKLSLSYKDAAVIDVGRRHATQMPEAIAKELAGLNVGGITKPRVIANGVSMLAVCQKNVAEDLTFVKGNIRQEVGGEQLKTETDKYLQDLRSRAKIIYS